VQGLLSRVVGIIGPIPEYMMKEGKLVSNFFTREGLIYMEAPDEDEESQNGIHSDDHQDSYRIQTATHLIGNESIDAKILFKLLSRTHQEAFRRSRR